MKNFTNNFKQFTSHLSARWLIMALMLLVGTSSAWGITIYYDNSQTPSYSKVYLHLGHDSYIKSYEMEFDAETSLYYKSWNQIEWNDAKYIAFTGQAISTDGLGNKFTDKISTYYTINMGGLAAISDYLFSSSGANADPLSIRIKNILSLNYIGFYIVEKDDWNQSSFAAITSESAYGATDVYHSDGKDDGNNHVIGVVYAPSGIYSLTHSASWNNCPKMTSNAKLGYAYYITGDNKYDTKEGTAASCDFSIDNTIKEGETSTVSVDENNPKGKSYFATKDTYEVDSYYVKKSGETALTKLEVEDNELQTQSLAVGEYTIYVLLFDGRIYAKGGEQTLTVETACDKPDAPDFGTNGVEVCEGTQVTLPTVTDVTLKWYDENEQETTDKTFNAIETQTYYAVVVGDDCDSDKTSYTIEVINKPTISLNPRSNTVCSSTLENIETYVEITKTEGSEVKWYASAQEVNALDPSTALDATSYFAEASLNGCSSDRAEFTITDVLSVPVIPSIDINQTTICSNDETGAKITVSNPQVGITYQVYKILGENPATTHGAAKKYSEGVLEFNSMKEAGTYYVRAYNEQCPNAIAQSLDEILTVIDANATSISISPETKTVNPWVPVTFTVTKQGNYDYTFSCKEKEGENDVTSNMVINKSGDTYVVKFPKPDGVSAATNLDGQVRFDDKTYKVEVKLNADVQCGTFFDDSDVTLTNLIENCPQP